MSNGKTHKELCMVKISIDRSSAEAFEKLSPKNLESRVQAQAKMMSKNKIYRGSRGFEFREPHVKVKERE